MDFLDVDFDLSKSTFKAFALLLSEIIFVTSALAAGFNFEKFDFNLLCSSELKLATNMRSAHDSFNNSRKDSLSNSSTLMYLCSCSVSIDDFYGELNESHRACGAHSVVTIGPGPWKP